MKLETFFEKFDQFADAPDAVAKMRELVLELGVTGKLTHGGDAWRLAPLGEVARLRRGYDLPTQSRNEGTFPIYAANGTVGFHDKPAVKGPGVVTGRSGSIGKVHYVSEDYWPLNTALYVEDFFGNDPEFACLLLRSLHLERFSTSTAVPTLNRNVVHKEMVRVPPLAEQKRIVAKVDELMALCDRLEAQQQERETRHAVLARASLARFADAPTPANLPFLFHPSYAIPPADLRKSILTLAVQGKLVPQDLNDEPAEKTLARLEALGGNAKTRRSVPAEVYRPDSLDVENLPESWVIESTARLLQLGAILDLKDGNHGANHPKVAEFTETGLPFITAAQVSDNGQIDYDGAYKVSGEALKRLRVGFAKPNDVIYTHKGSVGRVAICNRECVLTPQTTYYRVNEEVLCSGFVRINLLSPLFQGQVDLVKRQTTRDFVSINAQYQFFLRVPPLAEQRRIVAKVEQLMALVDALETQLAASRATAANLLSALVAELTIAK